MDIDDIKIDEELYSRQIYALGVDALRKMAASNVLVMGMCSLGMELAKNIVLAGVRSVSLYDPNPVQQSDLSQFFLRQEDLGQRRDVSSRKQLAELNPYVMVSVVESYSQQSLIDYQVVVCTGMRMSELIAINEFTNANGIKFIATDVRGLAGFGFCDFGDFSCSDLTGEEPKSGMIADICQSGLITCNDEVRHGLQSGDYVRFSEVKGMDLNDALPQQITVNGPFTFTISPQNKEYLGGGIFTEVKTSKLITFKSLSKAIIEPECIITDYGKLDRPLQLHCAFNALSMFLDDNGKIQPWSDADAFKLIHYAKIFAEKLDIGVDEAFIAKFAKQASGNLAPMAAIFGGLMAQEVLKACSGKLEPLKQFVYFDSFECLPDVVENYLPQNSRYDGQIAVFGNEMQLRLQKSKHFLVGVGAIGCEMLKNWAMMGIGTVSVADMDVIEKSNLNRQFLFRSNDVGRLKAEAAAARANTMNHDMKVTVFTERVGVETESVYNSIFWQSLDVVTTALDNIEARKYVDERCVLYKRPLLDSGTLGIKGSTQVVYPDMTESYSSSSDPPEKSYPICTLKNFPNLIEHTIQWARDLFDGLFTKPLENVNLFLSTPDYVTKVLHGNADALDNLAAVKVWLIDFYPKCFEDCVVWARHKFDEIFVNNIKQLLFNFPIDSVTKSNLPFWSGPKRAPTVNMFSLDNPLHIDFVAYAAILHAANYRITDTRPRSDTTYYFNVISRMNVPEFIPRMGVRISTSDNDTANPLMVDTEAEVERLLLSLPKPGTSPNALLNPLSFEKDHDENHHIDVIAACSNLRAIAYSIAPADRLKTKQIAGKIIPAIATTTAIVAGLVCLELYKILSVPSIDKFRNSFLSLAGPMFAFSEPLSAPIKTYNDTQFSLWDRFEVRNMSIGDLLKLFENTHRLKINMISCNVSILFYTYMQKQKQDERKLILISDAVELVTKKKIPPFADSLVLQVCACDAAGEDVDVPFILVNLIN